MKSSVPHWTDSRFKSFIVSLLRSGFRRFPNKFEVLKRAFTEQKKNKSSGRLAKHYQCASCGDDFPQTQIQIDHISPIVSPTIGFTTWDEFITNLFCEENNLQALCLECHKAKTKMEKQEKLDAHKEDSKITRRRRTNSKSK